jgi:hypothetical protein
MFFMSLLIDEYPNFTLFSGIPLKIERPTPSHAIDVPSERRWPSVIVLRHKGATLAA